MQQLRQRTAPVSAPISTGVPVSAMPAISGLLAHGERLLLFVILCLLWGLVIFAALGALQ